ncbi:MAG: hypothetical protein ACK4HW_00315 [Roseinatronobacter sp.]
MRSDELAEKLGKMFSHFGQGHDKKIKHKELDKVIAKLTGLRDELTQAAETVKGAKKAERMAARRDVVATLVERAEWLASHLPKPIEPEETAAPVETAEPKAATSENIH